LERKEGEWNGRGEGVEGGEEEEKGKGREGHRGGWGIAVRQNGGMVEG